ncbi:hypothetical protein NC652_003358 [Populus alba x Populus x berolinensis]|nr:hypothetical protein NC652_003358 [Populus alba x Populus x berolinensis]
MKLPPLRWRLSLYRQSGPLLIANAFDYHRHRESQFHFNSTKSSDWKAWADVIKLLKRLEKKMTILVVSHDPKDLATLVDHSWRMEIGGFLMEELLSVFVTSRRGRISRRSAKHSEYLLDEVLGLKDGGIS